MQTEKRLIYADDAKRAIEHYDPAFSYVIDNVPNVEVVLCKDCKHRTIGWNDGEYMCGNPYYGMASGVNLRDTDFCSYGERKDNAKEIH